MISNTSFDSIFGFRLATIFALQRFVWSANVILGGHRRQAQRVRDIALANRRSRR